MSADQNDPLLAATQLAASLQLVRPHTSIVVTKLTSDGRSWLLHAENWWPIDAATFNAMWSRRPADPQIGRIMGRPVPFPRRTSAFGVDYRYSGQTNRSEPIRTAPAAVQNVVTAIHSTATLLGHNAILLNWYDAANKDYIGPHSDDEPQLKRGEAVISLSWNTGEHYRRFRLTPRKGVSDALRPNGWGRGPGVVHVCNGDLVVMGGDCQTTHKHEIMKPTRAHSEATGRRINLTLRAFHESPAADRKRRRDDEQESSCAHSSYVPRRSPRHMSHLPQ